MRLNKLGWAIIATIIVLLVCGLVTGSKVMMGLSGGIFINVLLFCIVEWYYTSLK